MNAKFDDILRLSNRLARVPEKLEVVYANSRLLDDLFYGQFDGITNLSQAIEETDEVAIQAEAGVGVSGLIQLILNVMASVKAEGTITDQTRNVIERNLTLQKEIRLCEASLADQGLIIENPQSLDYIDGKYVKLVNALSTYTGNNEGSLAEKMGADNSRIIIDHWQEDQDLTPGQPQVVLASAQPFPIAAIVKVQNDVFGSTYIRWPPAPPARREVLAKLLMLDRGVAFLKTYWVVDIGRYS